MPRAQTNKTYRTFVKGLITEASPLTYPEDSSYDELNTILYRKGNRTRRLGQSYSGSSAIASLQNGSGNDSQNEFVWKAVDNQSNLNFLCIQKKNIIKFFDLEPIDILSSEKSFSIDLEDYLRPEATTTQLETELVQFAYGKGYLFIVSDKIEPIFVDYDDDTDTITVTATKILIRDFEGLADNLQNDEEPSTLSKEHHYNLQNQGWVNTVRSSSTFSAQTLNGYIYAPEVFSVNIFNYEPELAYQTSFSDGPITKYFDAIGRYPGNNKQWWVSRAATDDEDAGIEEGDFLPEQLEKTFNGNNRAPRGHYIIDAFTKDRTRVSGVGSIDIEQIKGRPNAIAFFSGRAWYGQGSTVYFSQILDSTNGNKAGLCYQEADPTAEDISDLIASDGGVVPIPEIDRIERLMPIANGVMVFAQNGVWFISGGDSAFAATNIGVDKVSSVGTKSPLSIVETGDVIFWWSEVGIQAIQQSSGQFGPIPGKFGNNNISEQTIQTIYNEQIPERSKEYVKGLFDPRNNTVVWLHRGIDAEVSGEYEYNNLLLYDLTLQSFYKWRFASIDNGPRINGLFLDTGYSRDTTTETVVDSGGVTVVDSENDPVTVDRISIYSRPSNIYYVVDVPSSGMTVSQTVDTSCADWVSFDGTGAGYDSYVETGFELHEDTMRDKQITYLFTHLERVDNSSCKLITKWDWASQEASNKWSDEVETYLEHTHTGSKDAFYLTTSKKKIRGNGRAIQFRYGTNEIGKNFNLFGWSVAYTGNTLP